MKKQRRGARGQILAMFLLIFPALILAVALAVEVGNIVTVKHEAQLTMDGAAYAATQAIDWNAFYTENKVVLDEANAMRLAGAYASMNSRSQRYRVRVIAVYASGDRVFAVGRIVYTPVFKLFSGARTWTFVGSAKPTWGIEQEGQ